MNLAKDEMHKEVTTLSDGRQLIYYNFRKPAQTGVGETALESRTTKDEKGNHHV